MSEDSGRATHQMETCPTCGTEHTAGSLRYDRNDDLRCPECIGDRAPFCGRCVHQWTGKARADAIHTCPACGSRTSLLPVKQPSGKEASR